MKRTRLPLIFGLAVAGLAAGYAGKRLTGAASAGGAAVAASEPPARESRRAAAGDPPFARAATAQAPDTSHIRSTDTLDSLKALPPGELYARLALWMLDASEEDIAAYWQHYRGLPDRSNEIHDLIFINWTRLDPRGATAAVAGAPEEHYAWWAWACHDPAEALAAAIAENPARINNVTWGIGEFHPDWLIENFDTLPEANRRNALEGLAKWDDVADPLKVLTFLKEKGHGFHERIFKVLIRKDPWAAYDWVQRNGGKETVTYGAQYDSMSAFVSIAAAEHPEMLERLAAQTSSGELKRNMETALFDNLLKTDPQAAMEQALAAKAPKIAEQRLTAVGLHLLASDPERAFEMAGRLLSTSPNAMTGMTEVKYELGSSSWGSDASEVNRLMSALLASDPARTMELALPDGDGTASARSFGRLTALWANQDLEGFSHWVNEQSDPAVRDPAAGAVINRLSEDQHFADAAEWAMSTERSRDSHLSNVLHQWSPANPAEAAQWLENAGLPAEQAERHLSAVLSQWAHTNSAEAVRWLENASLPAGQVERLRAVIPSQSQQ